MSFVDRIIKEIQERQSKVVKSRDVRDQEYKDIEKTVADRLKKNKRKTRGR